MSNDKNDDDSGNPFHVLFSVGSIASLLIFTAIVFHKSMQIYSKNRLKVVNSNDYNKNNDNLFRKFLDFLLMGKPNTLSVDTSPNTNLNDKKDNKNNNNINSEKLEKKNKLISLAICTIGLQVAYLLWGVMQEKIMTSTYNGEKYPNASLLVLSNRLFAIIFALIATKIKTQPVHRAPALEYSFAAVSNVISSYCQYEALRFVTFPMQTVSKASKVIPAMIMGTFVQGKLYSIHDYIGAGMITSGVALFGLIQKGYSISDLLTIINKHFNKNNSNIDNNDVEDSLSTSTLVGISLLVLYLTFDSFTSNWQSRLFRVHNLSPYQVMLGINTFSTFFSIAALIQANEFTTSVYFLIKHHDALFYTGIMSLCAAVGQLFIYKTINDHGPITFTIISVTRQLLSIVVSAILFGHFISLYGWLSVMLTFSGILYRTHMNSKSNKNKSSVVEKKN